MKVAVQKSPISHNQTFEIKFLKDQHFDSNWHFHPEYQIFVVLKGTGTRFIGDHVSPFREGDVVFTGPDLPHVWRSDLEYFEHNSMLWTEGIVIYFHEDFLGHELLHKNELYWIRQLFAKAKQGMEFIGPTSDKIKSLMQDLLLAKDFDSVLMLLNILNVMSHTSEYRLLSSEGYTNSLKESDTERMNRVYAYVMRNFRERITLNEAAAIANMTPTSFSRYFKTHANKTFSDFVTEIRIGYSCKLLIEKKVNISQACYESGFQTLSNFNRQFKAVTHLSPMQYRNKFNDLIA